MPISEADYKRLVEKYGRERIGQASEALVDIDAERKIATLKAEVRKQCRPSSARPPRSGTSSTGA